MMGSSQAIRDSSISVSACVLIVALGPIQFGFTCGYSSLTQSAITKDLNLSVHSSPYLVHCLMWELYMVGAITSGQISEYIGRKGTASWLVAALVILINGYLMVDFFFSEWGGTKLSTSLHISVTFAPVLNPVASAAQSSHHTSGLREEVLGFGEEVVQD